MRSLIIIVILTTGCSWAPIVHTYPSGLKIIRGDSQFIFQKCSGDKWDDGSSRKGETPTGCYDKENDTIFLQNTCKGAQALPHELAHKEGIDRPSECGYDW